MIWTAPVVGVVGDVVEGGGSDVVRSQRISARVQIHSLNMAVAYLRSAGATQVLTLAMSSCPGRAGLLCCGLLYGGLGTGQCYDRLGTGTFYGGLGTGTLYSGLGTGTLYGGLGTGTFFGGLGTSTLYDRVD